MNNFMTYAAKIKTYNHILDDTAKVYRAAVDFFIGVALNEWDNSLSVLGSRDRSHKVEYLTILTKTNPNPKYPFHIQFYKFPSYLRRAAIQEAVGKVSSYRSNLAKNLKTGLPRAGRVFPAMYRENMFIRTGIYTAKIKVFIRNTWDWIDIRFRKSDIDYINRHCKNYKHLVPTLRKSGKQWFLDFAFSQKSKLDDIPANERRVLAVDLGLNNACVCSAMEADGTVIGRRFLNLPREKDSLNHALNRVKKAQQHGNRKMPRLWARVNGINRDISVKTAQFIIDTAILYDVDVIVFEHSDLNKKVSGSQKQRLHLWKAKAAQAAVTGKAHRLGMRISHINAWNTSRLAYDGSGRVARGTYMQNGEEKYNYSMCVFQSGKTYNCDLNASYNIGARYYIHEILKSLPETERLDIEAKVPQLSKRSTCTLSSLFELNAELTAQCCNVI